MRGLAPLRGLLAPSVRRALFLLPLSVLLPLLLAQTWVFVNWYRAQRAHVAESNLEVARAAAASFDTFLADVLRQELTLGNVLRRSASSQALRKEILKAAAAEYPSVLDLLWVAPSGRVILSANGGGAGPDPRGEPYFRKLLTGWDWSVSGLSPLGREGRPVFYVARAVRDRIGALRGVVIAVLDPLKLGEVLAVDRPGGGTVLLLDDGGRAVYRYPEVALSWPERQGFARLPALRGVLAGEEAVFTTVSPIDARPRIYGAAPVPLAGWVAAASRPAEESLGPLARMLPKSAVLLGAALALAVGLAYAIGRLVRTPIGRLQAHARALGRGDLGRRISAEGPEEFHLLSEAFNRMAAALEERERERTEILAAERRARGEAQAAYTRIERIIESIAEGFLSLDAEWRFSYLNRHGESIFRRAREEVLGRSFWEAYPGTRGSEIERRYRHALEAGVPTSVEAFWTDLGRWIESHVYPVDGGVFVYFQDVSDRRQAENALRENEERLRLSNEAADIGVWEWDLERKTLSWDTRCRELLGVRTDVEASYDDFLDALHLEDRVRVQELLEDSIRDGGEYEAEYRIVRPDGELRWVLTRGRLTEGPGGHRMLGVALDVTKRKVYEEALARAKEVVLLDRAKSEFMALASHELHTPLNAIVGFTELLLDDVDGALNPGQRADLERIAGNARRLLLIADAILDLSRLKAGAEELAAAEFQLRSCLASAVGRFAERARAKGIGFSWEVEPDVPDRLRGDPDRLAQVLSHLLENAVKYTDQGGVTLCVARHLRLGARECLHFTVRDTGVGIPPERQAFIFRPFEQAEAAATRTHGGLGLGLAICQTLAEKMGGRLSLESEPGRGSTFRFTAWFETPEQTGELSSGRDSPA